MYTPLPDEKSLAGTGFTPADYEEEAEVWPENWPIVRLFGRFSTQWNIGTGGPTGLRYEAVYPLLDRKFPDADAWEQAFDDLQTLESAALDAMRKTQ